MRRFVKSLPPIAQDAALIERVFLRDIGRRFNPFSAADRETFEVGLTRTILRSLPHVALDKDNRDG